jgi:hypothetical protein
MQWQLRAEKLMRNLQFLCLCGNFWYAHHCGFVQTRYCAAAAEEVLLKAVDQGRCEGLVVDERAELREVYDASRHACDAFALQLEGARR